MSKRHSKLSSLIEKFETKSVKSALIYGSASVITQILMMIYLLLIARLLGAEEYGFIAAPYAATALTAFLFNWGFNEWMIKAGATSKNTNLLGGNVILLKVLLGLIWGLLLWVILPAIRPDLYLKKLLLLTLLDVWLDAAFGTLLVIPLLDGKTKLTSLLLVSSRLLRLLIGIGLFFVSCSSVSLILFLRFSGTLISFIVAWTIIKPTLRPSKEVSPKSILKGSFAFNAGELLNLAYLHADVNILSWMGANPSVIANYSIVINIIYALIMLPYGIYNALIPSLARDFKRTPNRFFKQIRLLTMLLGGIGLLMMLAAILLSKPIILTFMGESYKQSIQFFIDIAPLLLLRSLNQANIAYLVTVDWQAKRLLPLAVAVIIKILLGAWVISRFATGWIVWVAIFAEVILLAGYEIQVLRHYLPFIRMRKAS